MLGTALALALVTQGPSLDKHVYPLAKALVCPPIEVDTIEFPEGKAWAEKAKAVVEAWYPRVTELLATDGLDPLTGERKGRAFNPPARIRLVFKPDIPAPAYASGDTITVNGKWIMQNPNDLGMMVHELVHVVQQYGGRGNRPGWLVEGIADYIRWWRYEPELHAGPGRTRIDPAKAKYTDAYRTTAIWLAWSARKYDMRLVPALDKALRDGEDPMPVFVKATGKTADELWTEFVATQR